MSDGHSHHPSSWGPPPPDRPPFGSPPGANEPGDPGQPRLSDHEEWDGSGGGPPRRVVIGVCILVLLLAGLWLVLDKDEQAPPPPVDGGIVGQALIVEEEEPLADPQVSADREVVLFFSREGTTGLYPERRRIIVTASLTEQARQVIEELIRGPRRVLNIAVIPNQTKVRQIYLDREGNTYVDFSAQMMKGHPGGSESEAATLYAVVNSLTYNFPEIRSVQILIDGEERETLAGHIDLARRYYRDLSKVEQSALERLTGAGGPRTRR